MATSSPFSGSSTAGTAERGARSEVVRARPGLGGGELDRMPVADVGTGVGYLRYARPVFWRFDGRGSPGDDDRGSKAGSSDGAGRFVPAVELGVEVERGRVAQGRVEQGRGGSWAVAPAAAWGGDEFMIMKTKKWKKWKK